MKICPVCNDSFADQLNFCDIDGTRLRRAGSANERNKWWSLLGAGLLVAALIITAASIFFLPKARVSTPIVNSEPQATPAPSKEASAGDSATVAAAPPVSTEPETVPTVSVLPETKKKDKALADENGTRAAPNPKAAALAAEETDKKLTPIEAKDAASASKKTEASSSGSADDARSVEIPAKTQPPDLKKETKTSTPVAKDSDKGNDKKKNDEKDKKKGGFLRVFKKIFGKN